MPFASVAVLGPGLLGGSVALAVRDFLPGCELRLWARREDPLRLARQLGITRHTFLDAQQAVRGAELVILATPIGAFSELGATILPALDPGAVVTDVGSVKGIVHSAIGQLLTQHGHIFIGSHPMAGGEKQGLEHARADLLRGATVALTNAHAAPAPLLARLAAFWQALGGVTCEMSPRQHDWAVARISHMPHVVAALCAGAATQGGVPMADLRLLASTGFRDTTRVCSGGAAMWADIIEANAPAVHAALRDCIADLQQLLALLESENKAGILDWLQQAGDARSDILQRKG